MTTTPEPERALRAVPRTWSAVLADGRLCGHSFHTSAEEADDCAQMEEQVPGWGQLGPTLRACRKQADLLIDQVAGALDWSHSKLSRIETGQTRPSVTDVQALLALYRIDGESEDAQALIQLARQARKARKTRWTGPPLPPPLPLAVSAPAGLLGAAARLRDGG